MTTIRYPEAWSAPNSGINALDWPQLEIQVVGTPGVAYAPQRSLDGGTTYVACNVRDKDGNLLASISAAGIYYADGGAHFRLATGSGSTVYLRGGEFGVPVAAAAPPATAKPSANFTRPADTTAYASGDLVANSTTAGSVAPLSWTAARKPGGSGMIRRARLRKSGTSTANASFRLHLYAAAPTVTNGDNGAWLSTQAANYLGCFDITVDKAFSDGAAGNGAPAVGSEVNFALASGQTIYGLLEARGAYTPASAEVFTVDLEAIQD